jgi:hypothetical protein
MVNWFDSLLTVQRSARLSNNHRVSAQYLVVPECTFAQTSA